MRTAALTKELHFTIHPVFRRIHQNHIRVPAGPVGKFRNGHGSILYRIRVADRVHDRRFAEQQFTGLIGNGEKRRGCNWK